MAPNDDEKDGNESKKLLEEAQVRKLELEIKALERKENEERNTEEPRQKKLTLELKTLLWQTGRVYRISQFVFIISVLATVVTIFATVYGIWSTYKKDIESKKKERIERTDTLYRTEIQRLIQFPMETKVTISDAVFLFRDLEDVVSNGYDELIKQKRQKEEVGLLITQIVASPDFDLSLTRNIEFDRKAMRHSEFYRNYLIDNPQYNRDIISKYKSVLVALHAEDPNYSVDPVENEDEQFIENTTPDKLTKNQVKFFQYIYIFYAYKAHVGLIGDSVAKKSDVSQRADSYLGLSFCWFYDATKNVGLTRKIYGGEPEMVAWRWEQCLK